jgi:hypothetical protein
MKEEAAPSAQPLLLLIFFASINTFAISSYAKQIAFFAICAVERPAFQICRRPGEDRSISN